MSAVIKYMLSVKTVRIRKTFRDNIGSYKKRVDKILEDAACETKKDEDKSEDEIMREFKQRAITKIRTLLSRVADAQFTDAEIESFVAFHLCTKGESL